METEITLLGPMKNIRIFIICDSRGKYLLETLKEYTLLNFIVREYKGAKFLEGLNKAKADILRLKPDYVIQMNNICNLIFLDKCGGVRRIGLRSIHPNILINNFMVELNQCENVLRSLEHQGNFSTKHIFAPLVGCHLQTFNDTYSLDWRELEFQYRLNIMVERLNRLIYRRNDIEDVLTPHIANDVHHNDSNGHKRHRYERLAQDGLHYNDRNRNIIAEKLILCVTKDFYKNFY